MRVDTQIDRQTDRHADTLNVIRRTPNGGEVVMSFFFNF